MKEIVIDRYCLETCLVNNYDNNIIIEVEIENAILNLSRIEYIYVIEKNDSLNSTINQTILNETINITLNYNLTEVGIIEVNYSAVINEPVLWIKKIDLKRTNYTLISKKAYNITIQSTDSLRGNIRPIVILNNSELELEKFNQISDLRNRLKEIEAPIDKKEGEKSIKKLKELNYKIAIISSGPKHLAERAKKELKIDYAYSNNLLIKKGKIAGSKNIKHWPIRYGNKGEILRELCRKHNIDLKDAIVICNGNNDIKMARSAGLAIALNPTEEEITKYCNVTIKDGTLKDVLKFVEEFEKRESIFNHIG